MPMLTVRDLTIRRDYGKGSAIFSNLNLDVDEGEVLLIRGQSGCGKSTLLKCLCELNVYQGGEIRLHGKLPTEYGIPHYRTLVQYVPQRASLLAGTPNDLIRAIRGYKSRLVERQDGRYQFDPVELAAEWGIDRTLFLREWSTFSGGEAQRIALAIAVGIGGADIVLLDEPTSALDVETMKKVERSLVSMLPPLKTQHSSADGVKRSGTGPKALLWITHEEEQAKRVGTRSIDLSHR